MLILKILDLKQLYQSYKYSKRKIQPPNIYHNKTYHLVCIRLVSFYFQMHIQDNFFEAKKQFKLIQILNKTINI